MSLLPESHAAAMYSASLFNAARKYLHVFCKESRSSSDRVKYAIRCRMQAGRSTRQSLGEEEDMIISVLGVSVFITIKRKVVRCPDLESGEKTAKSMCH